MGDTQKVKIPRKGIEEYRKLVKEKYSLDISYAQAEEGFRDLLSLFQVIYRPIHNFDSNNSTAYNQNGEKNE